MRIIKILTIIVILSLSLQGCCYLLGETVGTGASIAGSTVGAGISVVEATANVAGTGVGIIAAISGQG